MEGLTLNDFLQAKQIFSYFDKDQDGFISEADLRARLRDSNQFDSTLIKTMVASASSLRHDQGISFEEFIEVVPFSSAKVSLIDI